MTKTETEGKVKTKEKVKQEPLVNTRCLDRSWPKDTRLVHLDRSPCSEDCMANNHDGKYDKPPPPEQTVVSTSVAECANTSVITTDKDSEALETTTSAVTTDNELGAIRTTTDQCTESA